VISIQFQTTASLVTNPAEPNLVAVSELDSVHVPENVAAACSNSDVLSNSCEEANRYGVEDYPNPLSENITTNNIRSASDITDADIQVIQNFEKWLETGNARSNLEIRLYAKNYRGTHAKKPLENDEEIIFVPRGLMLTLEVAETIDIGKKMKELEDSFSNFNIEVNLLAAFLLHEKKNPDSFWKPYIEMLPTSYDTNPLFYSPEEMYWLEGSPFQAEVYDAKDKARENYAALCNVITEFQEYTFEEYQWAITSVDTRYFGVVLDGEETAAFIPLADMPNHVTDFEVWWHYSPEKEGFVIYAARDYEEGEVVYFHYGSKFDWQILLNYGFTTSKIERMFYISFREDDPLLRVKLAIMQDREKTKYFTIKSGETERLLSFMRFVEMNSTQTFSKLLDEWEQTEDYQNKLLFNSEETPAVSIEVEMKALKSLKDLCESLMKDYPTSLEEDLNTLEALTGEDIKTLNHRNCLSIIIGEKKLLKEIILFTGKTRPLLFKSETEVQAAMTNPLYRNQLEYIEDVILPLVQSKKIQN
jgi:histone-lysine N-methyltransferase SETD3